MSKGVNDASVNSFQDGLNMDVADLMTKNTVLRLAQNVRILDLGGSSYVISNLQGTERKFTISSGFIPIAAETYNGVLYIVSENGTHLEVGSYPSPDPAGDTDNWVYRPFRNLSDGPTVGGVENCFRVLLTSLGLPTNEDIVISKLVIQPDYDRSVNVLFTIKGFKPRIVNSKFRAVRTGALLLLEDIAKREGNATSNEYSTSTVESETSTILYSKKILKIAFNTITTGGKLKCGNYVYVFHYMTEDFNKTNVIGQSFTCQIAHGDTDNTRKGGDETEETDKRVILSLSNLDTQFQYLKVYAMYNSGQEAVSTQYLEFTQPIQITGEAMDFIHTGYEELAEVSQETVNVDYATIEGADASTQVGGFYFLGGIKQRSYDFTPFKVAASTVLPIFKAHKLGTGSINGYADPANVYNYMGGFGGETYPWGMVYIMNDGSLSPVFPVRGVTIEGNSTSGAVHTYEATPGASQWYKGLVTLPPSNGFLPYDNGIQVKGLEFNLSAIPDNIKQNSAGFFFVRGERYRNLVSQGILIPTIKAPVIPDTSTDSDSNNTYWQRFKDNIDNRQFFKFLPCLDSMLEAFRMETRDDAGETSEDKNVLDENNNIKDGYMPIFINDLKNMDSFKGGWTPTTNPDILSPRHWAFLSGDAFCNEPYYVTQLNRDNMGIHQIGKVRFRVQGQIINQHSDHIDNIFITETPTQTGLWYEFNSILPYVATIIRKSKRISFVQGESWATDSDFLSALYASLYFDFVDASPDREKFYHVRTMMNAYFGVEMEEGTLNLLEDSGRHIDNPIGGNHRIGSRLLAAKDSGDGAISNNITSGVRYNNLNTFVNGAFLVNIYNSTTIPSRDDMFPTIDNVVYKQASQRYAWSDVPADNKLTVFSGDCFINKVYRKLNQSGERNSAIRESNPTLRYNIDQGQLVSWYQESRYNVALRQPKEFDASETGERSFFPYQSRGDFSKYRQYRLPETTSHSQGYSEIAPAKSFYPSPGLAPYIENYFFSRIAHSERHIPNAFRNGFRAVLPGNYKDYDSSMGQICAMFNLRGNLLVVFNHGIAITAIEQRVLTGADTAGGVFAKASDILPQQLTYISREIGSQDHLSVIATPGAVYGIDRSKSKIWKVTMDEGLKVISDEAVSSWLIKSEPVNPRTGYDTENSEVLFCTQNWTLVYREGLERFTSFYSFDGAPNFFARRSNELYSFIDNQAWKHNSESTFQIYEQNKECFVEVVVNPNIAQAKIWDFITLVSNEVRPSKVEFFTCNQEDTIDFTVNPAVLNQYTKVEDIIDPFTEERTMYYRDKNFKIQIPKRQSYVPGAADDKWSSDDARMRDKYLIIRLTYQTTLSLQLASIITKFRYSFS
jgi:hypothetical protein